MAVQQLQWDLPTAAGSSQTYEATAAWAPSQRHLVMLNY